jgi:transposase
MIYVGTDIGKEKFDVCSMNGNGDLISTEECTNDSKGFEKFLEYVKTMAGLTNNGTTIGVESTGIYHIAFCQFLNDHGFRVKVLNGIETKGLKDSRVRKGKSDRRDAEAIAKYLMIASKADMPFPKELENLKEYAGIYDRIRKKIRTTQNNLIRDMDLVFPGLTASMNVFDNGILNLLEKSCAPEDILGLEISQLRELIPKNKVDRLINVAKGSSSPKGRKDAITVEVRSLIRTLRFLESEKDAALQALVAEFQNIKTPLKSIPGIGDVTGAIIVSKIGDIKRFSTPEKLVAYSGLDPVIYQSGKSRKESRISKRGDHLLRYAMYQSALAATRTEGPIREFYEKKSKEGLEGRKLITACARKQCHMVWTIWTEDREYS